MTWLLLLVLPTVAVYLAWSTSRFGPFTPSALFAAANCLAAASIMPVLNADRRADVIHGYVLTYTLVAFCILSFVFESVISVSRPSVPQTFVPRGGTVALLVISIAIVLLYFNAVGYSALLSGIGNAISGGSADVATLRLDSYAGARYLFPGYVNQFKNILLPALTLLSLMYWSRAGRRRPLLVLALVSVCAFGLLGTAQRGATVMFAGTVVVFMFLVTNRSLSGRAVGFAIIVVGLLMVSTLALGRGTQVSQTEGLAKAGALLHQVGDRIGGQAGAGKADGFRYIYEQKPIVHGAEWRQAFVGLLPSSRGSTLANEIFAYRWGSTRGNAPPSVWASIYHNFGYTGVVLAPALLALAIAAVTRARERARRNANTLTLMGVAGVSVVIGLWTSGSPVVLLNNGIVVYALMWWWGARRTSGAAPAALPSDPGRRLASEQPVTVASAREHDSPSAGSGMRREVRRGDEPPSAVLASRAAAEYREQATGGPRRVLPTSGVSMSGAEPPTDTSKTSVHPHRGHRLKRALRSRGRTAIGHFPPRTILAVSASLARREVVRRIWK